jgi:hypothetical protein
LSSAEQTIRCVIVGLSAERVTRLTVTLLDSSEGTQLPCLSAIKICSPRDIGPGIVLAKHRLWSSVFPLDIFDIEPPPRVGLCYCSGEGFIEFLVEKRVKWVLDNLSNVSNGPMSYSTELSTQSLCKNDFCGNLGKRRCPKGKHCLECHIGGVPVGQSRYRLHACAAH